MTTPTPPVGSGEAPGSGWDDDRIDAALAGLVARVTVPTDLVGPTLEHLRPEVPRPWWGRVAPALLALVVIVAVAGAGVVVIGGPGGPLGGGTLTFRDGPTADLRTLDGGEYALDFPASWLAYAASPVAGSGGSMDAILTTQPIEDRCAGLASVDINCVYEQRLEPGQLRLFVGRSSYRAQTVLDRADIENGTTTRLEVGGMPAILDEFDVTPDDYYLADQSTSWAIATPASLARVIRLEFRARDPEAAVARAAADALVASFRFVPPPTPLPDDPEAAVAAARAALDAQAASFRQGFVPADDTSAKTYFDCLGDLPGEVRETGVTHGPGGELGWVVPTTCRWTVSEDASGPFWRIDAEFAWTAGEDSGRFRETYVIDAASTVLARMGSDDVMPARPDAGVAPASSCRGGLPATVITCESVVRLGDQAGARVDGVRIWLTDLGAVRSTMAPTQQTDLPDDGARVWAVVFDGRWDCCPGAVDENGAAIPISGWTRWLVVVEADREGTGFVYLQDWSDRAVPDRLPAAARPQQPPSPSASPTPTPTPDSTPWPPPEATVVQAGGDDGLSDIAVLDRTGHLVEARVATVGELGTLLMTDAPVIVGEIDERTILVHWSSARCEEQVTVEIASATDEGTPDRVGLYGWRSDSCRLSLIKRGVVLQFDVPVVAADIVARTILGTESQPTVPAPLPSATILPTEVFGLPVIDVEAALAIQARPGDDREIAVGGWFWENPSVARCRIGAESMFGAECGLWDALEQRPGGGSRLPLYLGPAVTNVDRPEPSAAAIVVVGHFDDRRSDACGPAFADVCADVFWVDTLWLNGQPIDRDWTASTADEPAPGFTHDQALARVADPDGEPLVPLSVGLISGALLGTLEPASVGRIAAESWIWLVTAYEASSGRVRTFVIPDSVLQNRGDGIVFHEIVGNEVLTTMAIID